MLLSPEFPFLPPHLFSGFFPPSLSPRRVGGRGGEKDGKRQGNVPLPSTHGLSPSLLPYGRSPGPNLCSRAGRGHFPATARSEATEGGRGESPPPAHLPGPRALRLRWRAGRLCPRPRKPPAPPAAAEASQRPRIATTAAAAAAVAALLPRGSRSAPASTGTGPTASRRRGDNATPAEGMWLLNRTSGDPRSPSSLFPNRCSLMEREKSEKEKGGGANSLARCGSPLRFAEWSGPARPCWLLCVCVFVCVLYVKGGEGGNDCCGRGLGAGIRASSPWLCVGENLAA